MFLGFVYWIDSILGKGQCRLAERQKEEYAYTQVAISQSKTADFVNYVDMVYADEAAHSKEISQLWQQYYIKK